MTVERTSDCRREICITYPIQVDSGGVDHGITQGEVLPNNALIRVLQEGGATGVARDENGDVSCDAPLRILRVIGHHLELQSDRGSVTTCNVPSDRKTELSGKIWPVLQVKHLTKSKQKSVFLAR